MALQLETSNDEFVVDNPTLRQFIGAVQQIQREHDDPRLAIAALRPHFAALLADKEWLPEQYQEPAAEGGMGSGIGSWLLYRASDGGLALSALVVPRARKPPCTIISPGAWLGSIAAPRMFSRATTTAHTMNAPRCYAALHPTICRRASSSSPRNLPMDADCFDLFARALVVGSSRRRMFVGLASGLLAGLPFTLGGEEAGARKKSCPPCKKRKKGKCKKRLPDGTACSGGMCQGGSCIATPSPPPPPPVPVPVLTYQCPGPGTGTATNFSNTRFAQVFTAAQSGSLHQIQIGVIKNAGSAGDYVVQLLAVGADGKPNNTVLAHAIVPNPSVPDGPATLTASFSGPPLVASLAYASAIYRSGADFSLPLSGGAFCAGRAFSQTPFETGAFFGGNDEYDLITSVTVLA